MGHLTTQQRQNIEKLLEKFRKDEYKFVSGEYFYLDEEDRENESLITPDTVNTYECCAIGHIAVEVDEIGAFLQENLEEVTCIVEKHPNILRKIEEAYGLSKEDVVILQGMNDHYTCDEEIKPMVIKYFERALEEGGYHYEFGMTLLENGEEDFDLREKQSV